MTRLKQTNGPQPEQLCWWFQSCSWDCQAVKLQMGYLLCCAPWHNVLCIATHRRRDGNLLAFLVRFLFCTKAYNLGFVFLFWFKWFSKQRDSGNIINGENNVHLQNAVHENTLFCIYSISSALAFVFYHIIHGTS